MATTGERNCCVYPSHPVSIDIKTSTVFRQKKHLLQLKYTPPQRFFCHPLYHRHHH
ncbi:hypothetical protein HanXRQr2_Chr09g0409551 [Helianthus annuus]|uniref:Uncharacterized protein n=1 Tax=Helianthus annuus TaxID=4232 RepID=A0A251U2C6_HELAN|nr:hypothetical protein HanXRQr2_Chr09g0409551 [Helianthus annuus]KAJ0527667.1 hypothetical protein HanHA300_Chr09g0336511 [Helianthus annuus]KAJ0544076.1 hypothetical protein HanHA89_Chr09g0357591 [Helianthus annuus]